MTLEKPHARWAMVAFALGALCLGAEACSPTMSSAGTIDPDDLKPNGAVPESPAFTFLGTTPSKVTTPGSTRDVGVSLMQGFDEAGHVRQGFALQMVPYSYLPGVALTMYDYRHDKLAYALANLQLSLGTIQTQGDSSSTDVAFGLRTTLVDRSDPLRDSTYCAGVLDRFAAVAPTRPHTANASTLEALDNVMSSERDRWFASHWGALRWSRAAAGGFRARGSALSSRENLGWSAWTTVSGSPSHLLGKFADSSAKPSRSFWTAILQYQEKDSVAGQSKLKQLSYGARVVYGGATQDAFLEVVGSQRYDAPNGIDPSIGQWSGGLEFKISEGVWVSTGFGSTFATLDQPDRVVVLANIRWAITSKSRIDRLAK
jgi:hypothetical protein